MASIILSGLGTVAGSVLGGPLGAAVGQAAGAFLGNAIDNSFATPINYNISGARLHDLALQTSTYGKVIPLLFGQCRIAGNVIWGLPIKEKQHTSEANSGGKGRKVIISNTSYSYSITLAIAICQGKIDSIINIWADAKNITNMLSNIRVYNGTEDQMPDSLIEAHMGAGKTPAYRGIAYVVIEDFPLADYGNRIPSFSFEVKRSPDTEGNNHDKVEKLVESICIIPGSGEFVYDTKIQYKSVGEVFNNTYIQSGKRTAINLNNSYKKADSLVALDQLQDTCPNLEWVAPVVTWFGSSLDIAKCTILPGVEFKGNMNTYPDIWKVAGIDRNNAHQITLKNSRPIYGGSVSDKSILRYLDELKERGYKIMFYPMLFIDLLNKPWRGHLTGDIMNVKNFFQKTNGYNKFILHYASLVKDRIDAFIIGSELKNLTSLSDSKGNFPAVDELVNLAHATKSIVGDKVKVTYAADWSEYHHCQGGWYNLDKLWSCDAIDFIGIDAYFPLTENAADYSSKNKIKKGWSSGEGYDFYYENHKSGKKNKIETAYAWKNIKYWWENEHFNPNGQKTSWIPRSKKIWFTEFGFPSVDAASNEPNIFYDPESYDGGLPHQSQGKTDFKMQRTCIEATLEYWKDSSMVERMFLWTWDARPYPYWPSMENIWDDGRKWLKGHWVNGKFGITLLAEIVYEICIKSGFSPEQIDVSDLTDFVDGYVINDIDSSRNVLETLSCMYFFDVIESEGIIKFSSRKRGNSCAVDSNDLICINKNLMTITRSEEQNLPQKIELLYFDRTKLYQQNIVRNENYHTSSNKSFVINSNLICNPQAAYNIAVTHMNCCWGNRSSYEFYLPFKYAYLEPGDLIECRNYKIRITDIAFIKDKILEVRGISDNTDYNYIYEPQVNAIVEKKLENDFISYILDIPANIGAYEIKPLVHIAIADKNDDFVPTAIYYSDKEDGEYHYLDTITEEAVIGTVHGILGDASSELFDYSNKVIVSLICGELFSVTIEKILSDSNLAIIGDEIIQFANARMIAPNKYELSCLLRGRMGTEEHIKSHQNHERFILLNYAVAKKEIPLNFLHTASYYYKLVPQYCYLESQEAQEFYWQGNNLRPLSPVHINYQFIKKSLIKLSWIRRSRVNGCWRSNVEVPLNEIEEKYEIEVIAEHKILDIFSSSTNSITIDVSKYSSITSFCVYQVSALVGRGFKGEITYNN